MKKPSPNLRIEACVFSLINMLSLVLFIIFWNWKTGSTVAFSQPLFFGLFAVSLILNGLVYYLAYSGSKPRNKVAHILNIFLEEKNGRALLVILAIQIAAGSMIIFAGLFVVGLQSIFIKIAAHLFLIFADSLLLIFILISYTQKPARPFHFKFTFFDFLVELTTIYYFSVFAEIFLSNYETLLNSAKYGPIIRLVVLILIGITLANLVILIFYLINTFTDGKSSYISKPIDLDQINGKVDILAFPGKIWQGFTHGFQRMTKSIRESISGITPQSILGAAVIAVMLFLTLVVRYLSLPRLTNDVSRYILGYYAKIAEHGGFTGLGNTSFSNYPPPLFYSYAFVSYFQGLPDLIAVKLVPIFFDYVIAAAAYQIIRLKSDRKIAWLGAALILLNPVIWLDSAYWGQGDAIYVAFSLFSILFFCQKRDFWGTVMFGISVSIKLQAIFLLPFVFAIYIAHRVNWKYLFIIPMTVFVMMLPALIAGQSSSMAFSTYIDLINTTPRLTRNAPSLFALFPDNSDMRFAPLGLALAALSICFISWLALRKRNSFTVQDGILLAALSTFMMPYFLPQMHERYFYLAALVSIVLIFFHPKLIVFAIGLNLTTCLSYFQYLWKIQPISLPLLGGINGLLLGCLVIYTLMQFIKKPAIVQPSPV